MKNLDRDDMMEALTEGVRKGFVEVASRGGVFDIPDELLYDAIRRGVMEAMKTIASNPEEVPYAAFYAALKVGAEAALERILKED